MSDKIICYVFSKDRAMQLHCFLSSLKYYCKDYKNIQVVVSKNPSSDFYGQQYIELEKEFPEVIFDQRKDVKDDLKIYVEKSQYINLFVDDFVFHKKFSMKKCLEVFKDETILSFIYFYGENTLYNEVMDCYYEKPQFVEVSKGIVKFDWTKENSHFGYPLHISCSLFPSKTLLEILENISFSSPNTFESYMNNLKDNYSDTKSYNSCFKENIGFCIQTNMVQEFQNDYTFVHGYSPQILGEMFNEGKRINFMKWKNEKIDTTHTGKSLDFISKEKE